MTTYEALDVMLETRGKFFAVEFTPRHLKVGKPTVRHMVCRIGVLNRLQGPPLKDWDGKPTITFFDGRRNLILVWDAQVKGYRSIPAEGLIRIKTDGEWIDIVHPT